MKDAQADNPGVSAGQLLAELEGVRGRLAVLGLASLDLIRQREAQLYDAVTNRPTESGARLIHLSVQLERAKTVALDVEEPIPARQPSPVTPLPAVAEDSEEHALPDDDSEEIPVEDASDEDSSDEDTEDRAIVASSDEVKAPAPPAPIEALAQPSAPPAAEAAPPAAEPAAPPAPVAVAPPVAEPAAPPASALLALPVVGVQDLNEEIPEPDELPDLSGLLEKVAPAAPPASVASTAPPLSALRPVPLDPGPVDEEATLLMTAADIRQAMARGPVAGADLSSDEAVPGSEPAAPPLAQVSLNDLRELDESDLLLEDDERLDEPTPEAPRPAPTPAESAPPRAGLFDGKGHAVLPTIRDPRDARPAAAAIQLTPDGQARAVGIGLDYFDEVKVALPPVDDEDSYDIADEGQGLVVESHTADEYEEEEEEADEGAHDISSGDDEPEDKPLDLSTADIRPLDEVDPAQVRELTTKAQQALDQGDLALAATYYSDLLDLSSNSIEAFLGRGRCYLDLGDFAAAMSDFQKAEDLDPNGPEPLVAMGELFAARKDYGRAIEFFDHAIALSPKHAMARCRRGICHYYKKAYRPAWLDLSDAERLDPNIPNIKQYVGMAKKKLESGGTSR